MSEWEPSCNCSFEYRLSPWWDDFFVWLNFICDFREGSDEGEVEVACQGVVDFLVIEEVSKVSYFSLSLLFGLVVNSSEYI